jgi:hypothetical protein
MLRSFWQRLSQEFSPRPGTPTRQRRRPSYRPQLLALEERVAPATLTVFNLNDHGPGSLRAAISASSAGDTINFAPNLAGGTINLTTGELPVISHDLTVQGLGSGSLTINGLNRARVFETAGGTSVSISGLTITNGFARVTPTDAGFGGAILGPGTLTVNDVAFINNTSATGGGVLDAFGSATDTLTFTNCIFRGNRALSGFGGAIGTTDTLTVTGSSFTDNAAPGGGGAIDYFIGTTTPVSTKALTVTNDTFTGNVGANGGAIYANDSPTAGTLTIAVDQSTFTNNQATGALTVTGDSGFGGAIDSFLRLSMTATASVTISNSTFTGNLGNYGAGIDSTLRTADSSSGTYTLTNVTSSGNTGTRGGGFYNEVLSGGSGSITVTVDSSTLDDNATAGVKVMDTMGASRLVSGDGAGAFNTLAAVGGPLTVRYTNDTIANNSAEVTGTDPGLTANGGGFYVENNGGGSPSVSLDSLTVAYNDAATGGGGLFSGFTGLMVRNTIVASNTTGGTGADVNGSVNSLGTNLIGNTSGSSGWVGSDLQNVDAKLSTLLNNGGPTRTIALLADSPAVGTGSTTLTTDQAGNMRSTPTDIGALEYAATTASQLLVLAPPTATANTPFDVVVELVDQYGNVVDNYTGTIHFTLSDPLGLAPADYTFTAGDGGIHTFTAGVSFGTPGDQTITVTDGTLTGSTVVTVM